MNFSFSNLFAGFVFGVFGVHFLKRGRNDAKPAQVFAGLAMLIYPYFVENPWLTWGIGVGLFIFALKV